MNAYARYIHKYSINEIEREREREIERERERVYTYISQDYIICKMLLVQTILKGPSIESCNTQTVSIAFDEEIMINDLTLQRCNYLIQVIR